MVTPEELAGLSEAEAVCLCEWEDHEGNRWSKILSIGSFEECREATKSVETVIVPTGVKCIGKQAILTTDLLPLEE